MLGRMRPRLAGLMFLHYLGLGAWAVPLATFLLSNPLYGGLGFSPQQIALLYSTLAVSGVLAPLFLGLFADQLFAAEKLLAVLYALSAGLLALMARACEQSIALLRPLYYVVGPDGPEYLQAVEAAFWPILGLMQCVAFVTLMSMTLTNIISLRNLSDPRKTFGSIRLFGTLSWMFAGFIVAYLLEPISPQMLWLASVVSITLVVYSLTVLPHTPPSGRSSTIGELLGLPALTMLRDRGFAIFLFCAFGTSIVQQFYSLYANKFLTDIGAPRPTAIQTLAQMSEVFCMALLPFFFARFTVKQMMVVGLIGWVIRNALFATSFLPVVVGIALPLHGVCYSFFFVVATLYVDRNAPPHLRASAQGIFVFATSGLGALLGNWLSAEVTAANTMNEVTNWHPVWLVPAGIASGLLLVFVNWFRVAPEPAPASPQVDAVR